ncbi:hypothetical protein Ahy_B01g053420 isoform A [Arachis hypogaea]|uniref:Uncharacterized protein n=1 Tax=Arachis hypogaea TaxID=3818 RepID=A0A445ARS8_ARAHY|nr:hypothetical protein Ahy_B01g053420 isoform A [Arachis hypogaea]
MGVFLVVLSPELLLLSVARASSAAAHIARYLSVIPSVARASSVAALTASAPFVAIVAELSLPLSSHLLPSSPTSLGIRSPVLSLFHDYTLFILLLLANAKSSSRMREDGEEEQELEAGRMYMPMPLILEPSASEFVKLQKPQHSDLGLSKLLWIGLKLRMP